MQNGLLPVCSVLWSVRLRPPADNAGGVFGCNSRIRPCAAVEKNAQAHERMAREVEKTRSVWRH